MEEAGEHPVVLHNVNIQQGSWASQLFFLQEADKCNHKVITVNLVRSNNNNVI